MTLTLINEWSEFNHRPTDTNPTRESPMARPVNPYLRSPKHCPLFKRVLISLTENKLRPTLPAHRSSYKLRRSGPVRLRTARRDADSQTPTPPREEKGGRLHTPPSISVAARYLFVWGGWALPSPRGEGGVTRWGRRSP